MENATRTCLSILNSLKGVNVMKKINMAKSCIVSAGLYASEATNYISKIGLERLERIQRNFAR